MESAAYPVFDVVLDRCGSGAERAPPVPLPHATRASGAGRRGWGVPPTSMAGVGRLSGRCVVRPVPASTAAKLVRAAWPCEPGPSLHGPDGVHRVAGRGRARRPAPSPRCQRAGWAHSRPRRARARLPARRRDRRPGEDGTTVTAPAPPPTPAAPARAGATWLSGAVGSSSGEPGVAGSGTASASAGMPPPSSCRAVAPNGDPPPRSSSGDQR